MDLNKLTPGDRVIAISGFLYLIFMFFPWYGFDLDGFHPSRNGWHYFLAWIALILVIAMVAQIAVARFTDTKLPDLGSLTWAQVHVIAAGLATLLVLLRVLIRDKVGGIFDHGLSRKYGLFLAFLAILGVLAGALLKLREPEVAAPPSAPPPPPPPTA